MHSPGDLVDPPFSIRIQPNSDIEVRKAIEGGKTVKGMPAFGPVHTTEHHITLGQCSDGFCRKEINRERKNLLAQSHMSDG